MMTIPNLCICLQKYWQAVYWKPPVKDQLIAQAKLMQCRASCLPMPNWNNIIQNPHYQNPSLTYNDNPYFICLQTYRRARLLEATRQGSTNSTSKIDAVARILFPASFGLFNIMYWLSYFHPQKPFEWTDHMLKGNFRSQCFKSRILPLDHKKKIFDKWRLPLIFIY